MERGEREREMGFRDGIVSYVESVGNRNIKLSIKGAGNFQKD